MGRCSSMARSIHEGARDMAHRHATTIIYCDACVFGMG